MRKLAALGFVLLAGCPSRSQNAVVDAAPPTPAPVPVVSAPPIVDAGPADDGWRLLNTENLVEPSNRPGGAAVHPEIELPARTVSFNQEYVPLRSRWLPALSADGSRVAHVYGQAACCRGNGYNSFTLLVFDAKTGATRDKVLLWTQADENDKALTATLAKREARAQKLLAGDWTTLGRLTADPKAEERVLEGEGLTIKRTTPAPFPPIAIVQNANTHSFPGSRFHLGAGGHCPEAQMALLLMDGFALRDHGFAIVETQQGANAPDGCEGNSMQFLTWQ